LNDTNLTTVLKKPPVGAKIFGINPNGRENIGKFHIEIVEKLIRISYI